MVYDVNEVCWNDVKKWIEQLSSSDLQAALEFPVDDELNEDQLLLQMIQMQAPPPNPIHPKALPSKKLSSGGIFDDDGKISFQRIRRDRINRPRLFQFVATGREKQQPYNSSRIKSKRGKIPVPSTKAMYDVIARKFVINGERLTVGCTESQRSADRVMLLNTVIADDPSSLVRQVKVRHMRFCIHPQFDKNLRDAIRIIVIASRGHAFKQSHLTVLNSQQSWFQPTERWFSLPMYLASRFERSLCEAYVRQLRHMSRETLQVSPCRWTYPQAALPPPSLLKLMIQSAVAECVANMARIDRKNLESGSSFPSQLLMNFWLEPKAGNSLKLFEDVSIKAWDRLLTCDLLLVNTPFDQLRLGTCIHLQDKLALYCQQQLEVSLFGNEAPICANRSNGRTKPCRRKSQWHKNAAKDSLNASSVRTEQDVDVAMEISSDDEDESLYLKEPVISFPVNDTSKSDRNRHTVLCLSIFHDVMSQVYEIVGLEKDTDEFTSDSPRGSNLDVILLEEHDASSTEVACNGYSPSTSTFIDKRASNRALGVVPECLNDSSEGEDELDEIAEKSSQDIFYPDTGVPTEANDQPDLSVQDAIQPATQLASESLIRNSRVVESFGSHYVTMGGAFYHLPEPGYVWEMNDDDWGRIQSVQPREQSLLADFFANRMGTGLDLVENINCDVHLASSTAASIDSLSEQADGDGVDVPLLSDEGHELRLRDCLLEETVVQVHTSSVLRSDESRSPSPQAPETPSPTLSPILVSLADLKEFQEDVLKRNETPPEATNIVSKRSGETVTASSLPSSPYSRRIASTLSREDLHLASTINQDSLSRKTLPKACYVQATRNPNLATHRTKWRDDHDVVLRQSLRHRKSTGALSSHRLCSKPNKAKDDHDIKHNNLRSLDPSSFRPRHSSRSAFSSFVTLPQDNQSRTTAVHLLQLEFSQSKQQTYARSDVAVEAQEELNQWQGSLRSPSNDEADNNTETKDGSTTITSLSQREVEEFLRDERNSYRDMCLTLGAEVAKLKNLLAAQRGASVAPRLSHTHGAQQLYQNAVLFGPEAVSNPFLTVSKAQTMMAMSDTGYKGEHESLASEDEPVGRHGNVDPMVPVSGSEASIDHLNSRVVLAPQYAPPPKDFAAISFHGNQSRLAREMFLFLESVNMQLRKQEPKRHVAIERMTRLVNAVWPRAQVKLYGSHITGLCLPSSDLDFVICLPEVHRRAVAVAPGALEGINAINETSQKLLARRLKGESWIDPRSMKLIDRTVVPVIKVSTKDTKAKMIQLDITFDAPGHHGIDAIGIVAQMLDEQPMIRPLVLVLKQFLLDKGLLAAYTGGISSYCLFLMVTRYLQEQSSVYGDGGSLLLGFLDFYGNYFDPRSTGISVRRREYFARPATWTAPWAQSAFQSSMPVPKWHHPPPHFINSSNYSPPSNFPPRESFSENAVALESIPSTVIESLSRPPRLRQTTSPKLSQTYVAALPPSVPRSAAVPFHHHQLLQQPQQPHQQQHSQGGVSLDHRIPCAFDPLWVEDPLSETNNVGRNSFRFIQVQRAFSDAHRALIAALEWDLHSSCGELYQDGATGSLTEFYPLLKSLLHSEGAAFEM